MIRGYARVEDSKNYFERLQISNKDVNFSEVCHNELLRFVIETPGIYAAMLGTTTKAHFISNLKGIL